MIAFDDEDLYPLADALLAKHGMLLVRPITHDPKTHNVNFQVEHVGEPGTHVRVSLPIDIFTDEMLAANTWLRALELEALRKFRGAKPE